MLNSSLSHVHNRSRISNIARGHAAIIFRMTNTINKGMMRVVTRDGATLEELMSIKTGHC